MSQFMQGYHASGISRESLGYDAPVKVIKRERAKQHSFKAFNARRKAQRNAQVIRFYHESV